MMMAIEYNVLHCIAHVLLMLSHFDSNIFFLNHWGGTNRHLTIRHHQSFKEIPPCRVLAVHFLKKLLFAPGISGTTAFCTLALKTKMLEHGVS